MEEARGQAVCGQEALDLLNCIAQSPYDQDKCLRLMNSLRECVLNKKVKKFSLADQQQKDAKPADKKA
ncbi:hypothetical protein ABKV19_012352 [Rosa sericea]|uniref:Putative cysteine alpha-hairpin motif superfamily n=1 Tax=Rosa chinensis TaxID=74649 RepID=A0A2P6P6D1_ROSCH|nr:putative cysteine alpha-hairpin motif superfamily [Rosa chinensis]